MERERRKNFRVEWNSTATIYDDKLIRPCILANFSNCGARIDGIEANTVPDEFTLRFTRGPRGSRRCRVLWRADHTLGVAFIDSLVSADAVDSPSLPEPVC
jgi:hypothetical protein